MAHCGLGVSRPGLLPAAPGAYMVVVSRFGRIVGKAHHWRGDYDQFLKDTLEPREVLTSKEHPCRWGEWVVRTEGDFRRYRPITFWLLWKKEN